MKGSYEIVEAGSREKLIEFLTREGQALTSFIALIEKSQMALDESADMAGRSVIEAVLGPSAHGDESSVPA